MQRPGVAVDLERMSNYAIYPSLKDRAVFVTGGGSGIGASIVEHFCAQGSKVAFVDIARKASEALVKTIAGKGLPAPLFIECNIADIPALQKAIVEAKQKLGPIRVLVNNAAHDQRHAIDTVTPEYWDERYAVNLKHQFFAAQAVYKDMAAAGGGAIVNLGSTSWVVGQGGMPCYTSAKSAVAGLTRALARDFGPLNIRVNCILPGWIMAKKTYRQAINEALRQEMERDPRVIIMGEDVAGGLGAPGEQDAWGGPLGVTKGLMPKFGRDRVLDTPISESAFVGAAVGAAATGLRPVAELMFVDFFGVCFDQIYNQAAKFKYMAEPMWDLAAVSIEAELDAALDRILLEEYFGGGAARHAGRFALYKASLNLIAAAWAVVQIADGNLGTDFAAFAHQRLAWHVLQVGATRDLLDGAAGTELRAYLGEFQIRESGRLD